jgi:hypothetical protein
MKVDNILYNKLFKQLQISSILLLLVHIQNSTLLNLFVNYSVCITIKKCKRRVRRGTTRRETEELT